MALRAEVGSSALIEIDGGVTHEIAQHCAQIGAEIFVTGVYTVYDPELGRSRGVQEFNSRMVEAGFPADDAQLERLRRTAR